MGVEEVVTVIFVAVWIAFVTLGCVLLASFWARGLSVALRALLATGVGALVLLVPVVVIAQAYDEALVFFAGGSVFVGVIGFPVSFLATRKLEREYRAHRTDFGSVFE